MAGESDEDAERKAENFDRMMNPSKYRDNSKDISVFSDKELQLELRKRKAHAKTEAERLEEKKRHNAPIERQISEMHQEINRLKSKLK